MPPTNGMRTISTHAEAAEQVDQADDRQHAATTPYTTRRAGDSFIVNARKSSRASSIARLCQGSRLQRLGVDAAREEPVGLARVAREQPLQVLGGQVLRVGVEEV